MSWRVASALSVLSLLLAIPRAEACKRRAPGPYLSMEQVPADGALVFGWQCEGACTAEQVGLDLQVVDIDVDSAQRVPLAGSLLRRGVADNGQGWGVWKPATPFAPGRHYGLSVTSRPEQVSTFEAVTRVDVDPDTLSVEAMAYVSEREAGERVCCQGRSRSSCGGEPCFYTRREDRVQLSLNIDDAYGHQWLYRTTFHAEGQAPVEGDFQMEPSSFKEFDELASGYCYKLEIERLADGAVMTVSEDCVPLDATELRQRALRDDELMNVLSYCDVAPPGYEDPFRDVKESHAPAPASSNESKSSSSDDASLRSDEGGCQLAGTPSPRGAPWSALLALALLVRRRRTGAGTL